MATCLQTTSFMLSFSPPPPPPLLINRKTVNLYDCHRNRRLRASSDSDPRPSVEVIGIGSRKDAVIDFCLSNPSSSSSGLRFWTVHFRDSQKVQLLQRCHGTDMVLRDVELPLALHPRPRAVILVASAGLGVDHIAAMQFLNSVKSAGGLTVAVLLKPFCFEGQRRLEEIDDLAIMLQENSHLYIVVETDSLLKAEMETLAEALESANNAGYLAMKTIAVLMSEAHLKVLNTPDGQMKEIKSFEALQLLETHAQARVGFGAGYNYKSAITQAAFHCPFLCGELKEFNGVLLFNLTSARDVDESDFPSTILSFREFTEFGGDIIFSRIHEPNLESNLIVASLLIVGCKGKKVSQKNFLSGLALHFPFVFSFLGRDFSEPSENLSAYSRSKPSVDAILPSDGESMPLNLVNSVLEANIKDMEFSSGESRHSNIIVEGDSSELSSESVPENANQSNPDSGDQREQDSNFNVGPGFYIAQLWAKEQAAFVGSDQIDMLEIFTLPVGVKSSSEMGSNPVAYSESLLRETSINMRTESTWTENFPSKDALTDAGREAITGIYNTALTLLKGSHVDEPRKRGLLSERAASMLESERESSSSWTRIVKMQYRGGIYRGRCQGGLPEGKGGLTFPDRSFYDGTWHYGKRSGLGTFCYSNGDVFQGAWRDDLMHGKGWFYFHTGDRWFANFWKGKANGEGRFYSNNGSIFFGCFQHGWRHGEGLSIDVDGSRIILHIMSSGLHIVQPSWELVVSTCTPTYLPCCFPSSFSEPPFSAVSLDAEMLIFTLVPCTTKGWMWTEVWEEGVLLSRTLMEKRAER